MTTIHHTPPPGPIPFAIYEDPEDHEPPSPSEIYEGDVSFDSQMSLPGADDAMLSIECENQLQQGHEHVPEIDRESPLPHQYSSSYTSRPSILSNAQSSRRTSGTSFISSMPSDISVTSKPLPPTNIPDTRYTPRKERPPFRNPSSVRAMQMSSPPPLPSVEPSRERLKGQYKLTTPSRSARSDSMSTTGSRRPRSHRDSMQRDVLAIENARHTPTPQQLPLVLLHVTILPMQMPYSHEIMDRVMPDWLVENYRILEEKLQDIILMRRGLLIPHPRDEYELLEERILESLELKMPRLLKCGHFVGPEEDLSDDKDEDQESMVEGSLGSRSSMSGGTITVEEEGDWRYQTFEAGEEGMCVDCHRPVKKPGQGIGAGTKRWDLKIYAANGLMRAGAWLAAWSEMESCDVEIAPWIPEDVRKSLEKRLAEEQEAARNKQLYATELQRRIVEEAELKRQTEKEAEIKRRAEEMELQRRIEVEASTLRRRLEEEAAEKKKLEETLHEKIEEAKEAMRLEFEIQSMAEANSVAERLRAMEETIKKQQETLIVPKAPTVSEDPLVNRRSRSEPRRRTVDEIPLGTLLKNYILLLLRDSSNFLLIILTALAVYVAMNLSIDQNGSWSLAKSTGHQLEHTVAPVVIISTATMTATSVATLTVTELPSVPSKHESIKTLLSTTETLDPSPASSLSGALHDPSATDVGSSILSTETPTMSAAESVVSSDILDISALTNKATEPIETSTPRTSVNPSLGVDPESEASSTINPTESIAPQSSSASSSTLDISAVPNEAIESIETPIPSKYSHLSSMDSETEASMAVKPTKSSDASLAQLSATPSTIPDETQLEILSTPESFDRPMEPLFVDKTGDTEVESVAFSIVSVPTELISEPEPSATPGSGEEEDEQGMGKNEGADMEGGGRESEGDEDMIPKETILDEKTEL